MKMAPSNKDGRCKYKYVCFDCRVSFKDKSECPTCRQRLFNVGSRLPIPPKRSVKKWAVLKLQIHQGRLTHIWSIDSKTVKEAESNFSKARKLAFDHDTEKHSKWGHFNKTIISEGY